jgi:pimeloyl-ACP methyl ester carboxylesterase
MRSAAASTRPGLVIVPTEDSHTGGEGRHRWLAERAAANVAVLPRLGHWWMLQDPATAADELRRFWREI